MTLVWLPQATLANMTREASSKLPLETGGVLAGYWANDDEVVIRAASGPGSEAEHFRTRFRPDHDYQTAWMAARYRVTEGVDTYLGDWHTHPGAHSGSPSRTDRKTARRIAADAEARAPWPLTLILAGDAAGWTPSCWVSAFLPFLGVCKRVQLSLCKVKTY